MSDIAVWSVSALTIGAVMARPFAWPEWVWAVLGAVILIAFGLESQSHAAAAFFDGRDVYFFLVGMMLLSEAAREEGIFDWLAARTTSSSRGSALRLFTLIYGIGIVVTIFMSNDATAVVLTPAVYACVKRAGTNPKPHLFACALIANAASFVLPISNPANLVVYGSHLPTLGYWLAHYLLPSIFSIAATYFALRFVFRKDLRLNTSDQSCAGDDCDLKVTGRIVLTALAVVAAVLLTCSAQSIDLGFPTFVAALLVVVAVSIYKREWPQATVSKISWSVIPLVGGLFVVVDALNRAQVLELTRSFFESCSRLSPIWGAQIVAFSIGGVANVANNLPVGLTAGLAAQGAQISERIREALLIGVDLGPNLSVTGSLATLLWLIALRREGETVGFFEFLKVGFLVMPISLFLSILVLK